ncbi:MAG: SPASM domain-containing protein [Candidatus Woesearchaeota archaeon]
MLFKKNSIEFVQIQTIDNCNLKCDFCPNSKRPPSGYIMENWVFEKIIDEIIPYVTPRVEIDLFLENEPLLDKNIFNKAKYVGEKLPMAKKSIISNGVIAKHYKKNIIDNFDKYVYTLYGKNYKQFNEFTHSKITEDKFNEIYKINKEIIDSMNALGKKAHLDAKINPSTFSLGVDSYSRGGFLDNWKIKYKSDYARCNKKEPFIFFNFLADGSMILCCMDYIKETTIGNIKFQSLNEILNSKRAKNVIRKARGEIRSEENFICKRCIYYKKSAPK